MGFRDSLGIIFSFHSWQATRERKKAVPSPQPKSIKTFHIYIISIITVIYLENLFRKIPSFRHLYEEKKNLLWRPIKSCTWYFHELFTISWKLITHISNIYKPYIENKTSRGLPLQFSIGILVSRSLWYCDLLGSFYQFCIFQSIPPKIDSRGL
jgi:hypothetical protein